MTQTPQDKTGILFKNASPPYYASDWHDGDRPVSKTITLIGSGFGASAPNVVLFDRFVSPNGSALSGTRAADKGAWKGIGFTDGVGMPRSYKSNGRFWMAGRDTTQLNSINRNAVGLYWYQNTYFTEFRYSKRGMIPSGFKFPGANSPGVFPSFSSWKMSWFADIDGSNNFYGDSEADQSVHDLCIPSHVGSGTIQTDGNTTHPRYYDTDSVNGNAEYLAFSLSSENMFSRYQSGAESSLGAHDAKTEYLYAGGGAITQSNWTHASPFRVTSGTQPNVGFRSFRENGWFGNGSDYSGVLPLISDVYLAVGANSRACIYCSDNPVFANSTPDSIHILPPNTWADGSITLTAYDYEYSKGYFHVLPAIGAMIQNVSWSAA